MIRRTKELGKISIPGALTPTEVCKAWDCGADFVKMFPAGVLGLEYLKAVRGPLRHIPMCAVGGISLKISVCSWMRESAALESAETWFPWKRSAEGTSIN